eukprot:jgi/Bigna1/132898/aug1.19_g7606
MKIIKTQEHRNGILLIFESTAKKKTRIERILSEQKDLIPEYKEKCTKAGTANMKLSKMQLISSIVDCVGKNKGLPTFFGNSALKKEASSKRELSYRQNKAHPRGPSRRPKSEETPQRGKFNKRSIASSGAKTKEKKASNDEWLRSSSKLNVKLSRTEKTKASHKNSSRKRSSRTEIRTKKIPDPPKDGIISINSEESTGGSDQREDITLEETLARDIGISEIEKLQEQRRKELREYLTSLERGEGNDLQSLNTGNALAPTEAEKKKIQTVSTKNANKKSSRTGQRDTDTSKTLVNEKANSKPLNVAKLLKRIEEKIAQTYPKYEGVVSLKDGFTYQKMTPIEDFGTRIDSLLSQIGNPESLGGSGMGFIPENSDMENMDRIDVQLKQLQALKSNSRPLEISERAQQLIKKLKASQKSGKDDGSLLLGTDRSALGTLKKGMLKVQSQEVSLDPSVVQNLVAESRRELGSVFLTQSSGSSQNVLKRNTQSEKQSSMDDSDGKSEIDPEVEVLVDGYNNLKQALQKGKNLEDYYPDVDLTKRRMDDSLVHLNEAMHILKDSKTVKNAVLQAHAPESHQQPLASSKSLPPLRASSRQMTNIQTPRSIQKQGKLHGVDVSAQSLVAKMHNLMGNMEKKMQNLEGERYDI